MSPTQADVPATGYEATCRQLNRGNERRSRASVGSLIGAPVTYEDAGASSRDCERPRSCPGHWQVEAGPLELSRQSGVVGPVELVEAFAGCFCHARWERVLVECVVTRAEPSLESWVTAE